MPYNSVVLAATTGPVGSAVPTAILTPSSAPVGCFDNQLGDCGEGRAEDYYIVGERS